MTMIETLSGWTFVSNRRINQETYTRPQGHRTCSTCLNPNVCSDQSLESWCYQFNISSSRSMRVLPLTSLPTAGILYIILINALCPP
ncbi:hypothetical protein XELAEV_18013256mg [Xenopus laevis]|uniref:Uncharacterized protein n=1 Tax=Xenopus laevis TaxID=8355 RepID=A0A974HYZ7_XENLA|nr:hypothetical protein XELAEV_18013256mg [Xenopus laevis]